MSDVSLINRAISVAKFKQQGMYGLPFEDSARVEFLKSVG